MDLIGVLAFGVALLVALALLNLFRTWSDMRKPYTATIHATSNLDGPSQEECMRYMREDKNTLTQSDRLVSCHDLYGDAFVYWFGTTPNIILCSPVLAQHVLSSNGIHVFERQRIKGMGRWRNQLVSRSLIMVDGEEWRFTRRAVSTAFHYGKIKLMVPVFEEVTNKFMERINEKINDQPKAEINVHPLITQFAVDVLGRTVCNIDFEALDGKAAQPLDDLYFLFRNMSNPWRMIIPFVDYLPTQKNRMMQAAVDRLNHFFLSIIDTHKKHRMTEGAEKPESRNLLDLILEAKSDGKGMSKAQLRDNVFNFFVAGHETTSSAFASTLYHLAKYTNIQEQVAEEAKGGLKGGSITFEEVEKMKLMLMVIKESLRLYPPAPLLRRQVVEDIEIEGILLKAKAMIAISVHAIHRDPKVWENPNKFDPYRFSEDRMKGKHTYSFIPFSGGQRICIGNKFSLIEIATALSFLLVKFRFRLATDQQELQFDVHPFMRPSRLNLVIERR